MQTLAIDSASANEVHAFVAGVEQNYMLDCPRGADEERRTVQRMNVTMPLVVTPLDEDLRSLSYRYHAITRDLSQKGVGFVTNSPVRPSYVRLTFEPWHGNKLNVIARVVYCKEVGYYFQVGCEFLLREI